MTAPVQDGAVVPPSVLMIVGNDVRTDSRVKREALGLASAGFEVTVLGYTAGGRRDESWLGPVRVIRLPVEWTLRDHRLRRRAARRRRRPPLLRPDALANKASRRRLALRGRAVKTETGRALRARDASRGTVLPRARFVAGTAVRRARMLQLRVLRLAHILRDGARRRVNRLLARAWGRWDDRLDRTTALARWERVAPEINDFEAVFGPVIDELAPDVIHAHDFHMVGLAAAAVARARLRGRTVRWVYDAHEFVPGLAEYGTRTARVIAAWADLERRHIRDADRVITVSPTIADELQRRHRLARRPAVVLNTPVRATGPATDKTAAGSGAAAAGALAAGAGPSMRAAAGVEPGTPLLVYSGGLTAVRGVEVLVDALPLLPGVHLAIVPVPFPHKYADRLVERAEALGVADRLHVLAPVDTGEVVSFLSSASAGVHPLLRGRNHDLALPNKLFEYLAAGLPQIVSDCPAMAGFVTEHGLGVVFPAGDAEGFAAAARKLLDDRDAYRDAVAAARSGPLADCTWDRQEEVLRGLYRELLADHPWVADASPTRWVPPADRPRMLGIGPANMAGQAGAWAAAVQRVYPQVRTEVVAVRRPAYNFGADLTVTADTFARDPNWQRRFTHHVLSTWTHALLEAGRPVMGTRHGRDFRGDVAALSAAGLSVALVFHGSEIRDPRRHAAAYPWSPFTDPDDPLTARLQRQVDELAPLVADFDGTTFVSTPDLLDDLPAAQWLPVVIDTSIWRPGPAPLRRDVPVVVHAPSNPALKGTAAVEAALTPLIDSGRIAYRRLENIPPEHMHAHVLDADVVLDHFVIGNYGVLACEAMAAGRVTVGHVHQRVRDRLPAPLPVIEATLDTLAAAISELLDARDTAAEHATHGPGYVTRFHDGTHTARVLAPFLGLDP